MVSPQHRYVHSSAKLLDGFFCCLCWDRFPWSALGAFDRRLRWCDSCADWYERLLNPPTFWERAA